MREMEEKLVEIKQVSEREFLIGETIIYLDEDNILYETLVGEQDEEIVNAIKKVSDKLKDMVEGKVNNLVDLNKTRKDTPGARKAGQKVLEDEKIGKVALFGMHPVAKVIASFVMGFTKKNDIRFFNIKEEAFAWLRE